jgi:hypothetical protein
MSTKTKKTNKTTQTKTKKNNNAKLDLVMIDTDYIGSCKIKTTI